MEARNIVSKAQQEAEELAGQLLKETLDKGKGLMVEAQAQAAKEIEALKEENKAKISELRAKAQSNLDEAVSFVLGRIVKDYGRN